MQIPVIHHMRFDDKFDRDGVVIHAGSCAGALMVDGLGDGVMIEAPHAEPDFLRTTSFGLLQVRSRATTKLLLGARSAHTPARFRYTRV
jgi:(E)-4-hydroxy-3-methylbut-2-enyl-diphosphate synthase